jgi:hypothetical protein
MERPGQSRAAQPRRGCGVLLFRPLGIGRHARRKLSPHRVIERHDISEFRESPDVRGVGGDVFAQPTDCPRAIPEERANPSLTSWADPGYLAQQQRRLPAHKYRRLHLNLPGLPEGSAYQPDPIADAIERGAQVRPPQPGLQYVAFTDLSGGSNDDAVLAIAHRDLDGRAVLDCLIDQGQRPPFDPNAAVSRFVRVLRDYRVSRVTGDRYAGQTFSSQFTTQEITYVVAEHTTSELYEALEPRLNSGQVVLLDAPVLEQQLLGLVWKGGKITHQSGEHDDFATAAAGVVEQVLGRLPVDPTFVKTCLEAGSEPGLMPTIPALF